MTDRIPSIVIAIGLVLAVLSLPPARVHAQPPVVERPAALAAPAAIPALEVKLPSDAANDALWERLERRIDWKLREASLAALFDRLRRDCQIDMQVERESLEAEGVTDAATVTGKLSGVKTGVALRWLLASLNLGYVVEDGMVVCTARQELNARRVTRIYPVADLRIDRLPANAAPWDVAENNPALISLIESLLYDADDSPNAWSGSLSILRGSLVATLPEAKHRRICSILTALRRLDAARAVGLPKPSERPPVSDIERALVRRIDVTFQGTTFRAAIDWLRQALKIPIHGEEDVVDLPGVRDERTYDLELTGVPAHVVLDVLLAPYDAVAFEDDGLLVIARSRSPHVCFEPHAFDVAAIIADRADGTVPATFAAHIPPVRAEQIADVLQRLCFDPHRDHEYQLSRTAAAYGNVVFVRQVPQELRRIREFLAALAHAHAAGPPAMSPLRSPVETALARQVDVDFQDAPLTEVAAWIRRTAQVSVYIDPEAIASEGALPATKITFRATKVSIHQAVQHILATLRLSTTIPDGAYLRITTQERAAENQEVRSYNVLDLVTTPGAKYVDFESLKGLLYRAIRHRDYLPDGTGDLSQMAACGDILAIRAPADAHADFVAVFERLRQAVRAQAAMPRVSRWSVQAYPLLHYRLNAHAVYRVGNRPPVVSESFSRANRSAAEDVRRMLLDFIEPASWQGRGGEGAVRIVVDAASGAYLLVVRQTAAGHLAVRHMLEDVQPGGGMPIEDVFFGPAAID